MFDERQHAAATFDVLQRRQLRPEIIGVVGKAGRCYHQPHRQQHHPAIGHRPGHARPRPAPVHQPQQQHAGHRQQPHVDEIAAVDVTGNYDEFDQHGQAGQQARPGPAPADQPAEQNQAVTGYRRGIIEHHRLIAQRQQQVPFLFVPPPEIKAARGWRREEFPQDDRHHRRQQRPQQHRQPAKGAAPVVRGHHLAKPRRAPPALRQSVEFAAKGIGPDQQCQQQPADGMAQHRHRLQHDQHPGAPPGVRFEPYRNGKGDQRKSGGQNEVEKSGQQRKAEHIDQRPAGAIATTRVGRADRRQAPAGIERGRQHGGQPARRQHTERHPEQLHQHTVADVEREHPFVGKILFQRAGRPGCLDRGGAHVAGDIDQRRHFDQPERQDEQQHDQRDAGAGQPRQRLAGSAERPERRSPECAARFLGIRLIHASRPAIAKLGRGIVDILMPAV